MRCTLALRPVSRVHLAPSSERPAAIQSELPDGMLQGLDDIDTTIARRALDVLDGTATINSDAWRTLTDDAADGQDEPDPVAQFVAKIAAAAAGDTDARAAVELQVAAWTADPNTAALATALRRILDCTDDPATDGDLPPGQAGLLVAVRHRLPITTTNSSETDC